MANNQEQQKKIRYMIRNECQKENKGVDKNIEATGLTESKQPTSPLKRSSRWTGRRGALGLEETCTWPDSNQFPSRHSQHPFGTRRQ